MTNAGVRVKGLRETQRALTRLGVEASELKQAMTNVSSKAVQDAKSLAPAQSGRLKASIRGNKAKAKAIVKAGTKAVYWASFQEWGTSKISAKEYVTKAVQDNESYAAQQIEKELRAIIKRNNLD